jgi:hypothetical protein
MPSSAAAEDVLPMTKGHRGKSLSFSNNYFHDLLFFLSSVLCIRFINKNSLYIEKLFHS